DSGGSHRSTASPPTSAAIGRAGRSRPSKVLTMPNPVFDAVRTVLAVREYQDKGVADDVVRRVAEAGRLTASGQNRQPWHFVIVRDRTVLQRLGKQVRTGPYVAGSAFAVVVAIEKDNPLAVSDASRA